MEKESMEYYKGKVIMNMEDHYKQLSFPAAKKQHVHETSGLQVPCFFKVHTIITKHIFLPLLCLSQS